MRFDRRDLRAMPAAIRERLSQRSGCWQALSEIDREGLLAGAHGATSDIAARYGLKRSRLTKIRLWVRQEWERWESDQRGETVR